jgi:hypothetical protein
MKTRWLSVCFLILHMAVFGSSTPSPLVNIQIEESLIKRHLILTDSSVELMPLPSDPCCGIIRCATGNKPGS